jgi:hypothetical protein
MESDNSVEFQQKPSAQRPKFSAGKGALTGAVTGASIVLWELLTHPCSAKMDPGLTPEYLFYLGCNTAGWAAIGAFLGALLGTAAESALK